MTPELSPFLTGTARLVDLFTLDFFLKQIRAVMFALSMILFALVELCSNAVTKVFFLSFLSNVLLCSKSSS